MKIHHLGFEERPMRSALDGAKAEPKGDMKVPRSRLPSGEVAVGDLLCIESLDGADRPTGPALLLRVTGVTALEADSIHLRFDVALAVLASSEEQIAERRRLIVVFNGASLPAKRRMIGEFFRTAGRVDVR